MRFENTTAFISYRRDKGAAEARILDEFLRSADVKTYLDVDQLDSGHFDEQLLGQIERHGAFVLVCSPGCFDRCADPDDWLRREIAHAIKCGRRIVPVELPGFGWPTAGELPEEIREVVRHHAFQYSHSHWSATKRKLLRMLGNGRALPGPGPDDPVLPPGPGPGYPRDAKRKELVDRVMLLGKQRIDLIRQLETRKHLHDRVVSAEAALKPACDRLVDQCHLQARAARSALGAGAQAGMFAQFESVMIGMREAQEEVAVLFRLAQEARRRLDEVEARSSGKQGVPSMEADVAGIDREIRRLRQELDGLQSSGRRAARGA